MEPPKYKILALLFLCLSSIYSQEVIKWNTFNFPPAYIIDGDQAGRGYLDKSLNFVINQLDSYTHKFQTTNVKRLIKHLINYDNVATNGLLKTQEREEFVHHSIISQVLYPNYLIIKTKDLYQIESLINSQGKISLDLLLTNTNFRLGVVPERSYGEIIDSILAKHKDSKNIYTMSLLSDAHGVFKTLSLGRIDYAIEYPQVANYKIKIKVIKDEITMIPIEGLPDTVNIYFSFPKNEWGSKLRNEVNNILLQYRHTDEYLSFYTSWLEEDQIEKYKQLALNEFNKEFNPK